MKHKILIYDIDRLGEFVATLVASGYSVNVNPKKESTQYEHWVVYEVEYEECKKEQE